MADFMGGERGATSVNAQARPPVSPLLPGPARRPAAIGVVCCAAILGIGAGFAAGRSQGNALDRPIDSWIIARLSGHLSVPVTIADLGTPVALIVFTVILVAGCLAAGRVNGAILTIVCVPVASAITELALKPLVHETIGQNPPGLSYPSGHTTNVFVIIAILAVLLANPPHHWPSRRIRITIVAVAVLIGCLVIVSLIAIQFHYFTDTVGGICVSTGLVVGVALLLDLPAARAVMSRWPRRVRRVPG
jgi:membrane-associated phospholipid phosphatase